FKGLRWRLTTLYLASAMVLVALIGGGAYQLLALYFQNTTDLALQHVMAVELQLLDQELPPELETANAAWFAERNRGATPTPALPDEPEGNEHDDDEESDDEHEDAATGATRESLDAERANDGQLASVFVLALSDVGQWSAQTSAGAQVNPDNAAAERALVAGRDLVTVRAGDGTPMRLLTYRVMEGNGVTALQVGRSLRDQDQVLGQLLLVLLGLSAVSAVFVGVGSWWLAGRSLGAAQNAWTRQQAFISNASHELRTPLTLLRASAEVALRELPRDDTDARALLGDVLQETDHMARLVDDLLVLSRLDAGRLTLERKPVALDALLTDIERQMGRVAETAGVSLTAEAEAGVVSGDVTRLRQVILILLDNALRHTPAGGAIRLQGAKLGRRYQITVTDTGSGIPAEHLPHVFDRFYRADSARSARPGQSNVGLGLSIARALTLAHAGQIEIASPPGQGVRVTLTLPLAPA
ncbi:MAG: hypothetical protein JNL73_14415, partial [Anaerolineales bacterium]|nr:hypothetical protein [Anaerolineales bacterium]